ncbi:ComF family protein [Candidatus Neomarinimicrobiota bacterium]
MRVGPGILPNPLDLLFPSLCCLCTAPVERNQAVCEACLGQLTPTGLGQWAQDSTIREGLDGIWSAFWFDEAMQSLVHQLKYQGRRRIGEQLGQATFTQLSGDVTWERYDVMVPIPLYRPQQRERGFNQSAVLAQVISQETGLLIEERLIVRHRRTRSQTGLSVSERQENVADCFRPVRSADNLNVLLLDDVLTTGATASACAQSLKAAGCAEVAVLTVATPQKVG